MWFIIRIENLKSVMTNWTIDISIRERKKIKEDDIQRLIVVVCS
jgi:hypothetical protein